MKSLLSDLSTEESFVPFDGTIAVRFVANKL